MKFLYHLFYTTVLHYAYLRNNAKSELGKIDDAIERYYEPYYDMCRKLEEVSFADVSDMDSVQSHNKAAHCANYT